MDQAIILHIIKHHITPLEAITMNHTIVHLMVATVPTKSVKPITRQFTKLSLNTRRSRTVKMFPRKFASILRKRFAIKKNIIKNCKDVPKEVCEHIEKEICHQEEHHQNEHHSGGSYNNHYQHMPEVCHPESRRHCMTHHENVCHYESVDVPHKEPVKVPEQICHVEKHPSYGSGHGSHHGK